MIRAGQRHAFTLAELLVTMAIVAVLIMLLLPAVQAAREAARQVECRNNIKQLALACHSHHDVHGHFPTGGWGWFWIGDPDRGFGVEQPGGWIYNLLPYYESGALHDQPSDGQPELLSRHQRIQSAMVIQTPLAIINCPSRRANTLYPLNERENHSFGFFNSLTPPFAGRSDYAINSGHVYNEWPVDALGRGPRSYADARSWTANKYWGGQQTLLTWHASFGETMTGVSYERSAVAVKHVTDGLSNTYLIGERHIPRAEYDSGYDIGDNETWCTGFNNDNFRKTGRLKGGAVVEASPTPDHATGIEEPWGRFGSAHKAIWNAAFCDGSVRAVSFDIDWRAHRDMGNRMDGRVVDEGIH